MWRLSFLRYYWQRISSVCGSRVFRPVVIPPVGIEQVALSVELEIAVVGRGVEIVEEKQLAADGILVFAPVALKNQYRRRVS